MALAWSCGPACSVLAAPGSRGPLASIRARRLKRFSGEEPPTPRAPTPPPAIRAPRPNPTPRQLGYKRRPHRYWADFENVEKELRTFIAANHLPDGVMPSLLELRQRGALSLYKAVLTFGGARAVAERLGFLVRRAGFKSRQRWRFLTDNLATYLTERGPRAPAVPRPEDLRQRGKHELAALIEAAGGPNRVVARLGLTRPRYRRRHPRGYYDDFANLEREIREAAGSEAALAGAREAGLLPAARRFHAAGRLDILRAIQRHGGFRKVAERLGLEPEDDPDTRQLRSLLSFLRQLRAFIAEHGVEGYMPTANELRRHGAQGLVEQIRRRGGTGALAARLGLQLRARQRGGGLFMGDLDLDLAVALLEAAAERGSPGMPSPRALRDAGLAHLEERAAQYGGLPSIARRLGVAYEGEVSSEAVEDFRRRAAADVAEERAELWAEGLSGEWPPSSGEDDDDISEEEWERRLAEGTALLGDSGWRRAGGGQAADGYAGGGAVPAWLEPEPVPGAQSSSLEGIRTELRRLWQLQAEDRAGGGPEIRPGGGGGGGA